MGSPLQELIGAAGRSTRRAPGTNRPTGRSQTLHVHWFRWVGSDAFSSASLYACRCGEVQSGL